MTIKSPQDMMRRNEKEARFYRAIRGVDDAAIDSVTPRVVQFMASEMSLLGDLFIQ
jgi:hypothetical protein